VVGLGLVQYLVMDVYGFAVCSALFCFLWNRQCNECRWHLWLGMFVEMALFEPL